ncbi:DNA polymerase III subunit delta' [Microbacterium sorbitolivorans]|uniref:DNA polymerase III subunit delta' n=1 Tax=Microbacterium sorbitolivorans TaxID=1867410 RepID=A0A367XUN2_9MICO|nr:DNA polymerase III subunit delta' [Microbacterium sorbitolivorans]RCK57109.1 DNA polymerase III subunit delta' [Microbacterium sorbitolivorans]GGF46596.1 DNA polymerase III subunit delta' [Microbacterium sorbitolivorans]
MTTAPAVPWGDALGQEAAVEVLREAAADPSKLAHGWLLTGPPGSGRSTLARAFAAALIADGEHDEATMKQVLAGTHPDLTLLKTEGVIIRIDDAREVVERSYYAPSAGRYRVVIIEDADRMVERTSNVLLKALEEPPEQTIWVLCAPSDADLLPTIRSRVRMLRLRELETSDVASLLMARTGADPVLAEQSARHAQRHIGMAQRLVTDEASRIRRDETMRDVLALKGVGGVVDVAARIVTAANDDAKALTIERDEAEKAAFLRTVGVAEGARIPPPVRSQLRALTDEQDKRSKRSVRDGLDRVLTDLQSLFRDIVLVQLGRENALINLEYLDEMRVKAEKWTPERTLTILDHLAETRVALERNVQPALAFESLLLTVVTGRKP